MRLTALHGEILIQTLVVPGADVTLDSVRINGSPVDATVRDADGKATVQFPEPIILNPGDMLQVDR